MGGHIGQINSYNLVHELANLPPYWPPQASQMVLKPLPRAFCMNYTTRGPGPLSPLRCPAAEGCWRCLRRFKPDGGYIPRIMFFTPEGEILPEYNSGNQKYLYFYGTGSQATLPLPSTTHCPPSAPIAAPAVALAPADGWLRACRWRGRWRRRRTTRSSLPMHAA